MRNAEGLGTNEAVANPGSDLTDKEQSVDSELMTGLEDSVFCNSLERELERSNPLSQLRLLERIYKAADNSIDMAMEPYFWIHGEPDMLVHSVPTFGSENARKIFEHLAASDKTPPLSSACSKAFGQILSSPELKQYSFALEDTITTVPIAPGVRATTKLTSLGDYISTDLVDEYGNKVSLSNPESDNFFNLDKNKAFLLKTAHSYGLKTEISREIGLDLEKIPLDGQVSLLEFMIKASKARFSKLCDTLHRSDQGLRLKLAENFVAADFGEDFGDSLLEIVDSKRFSDKEKEQILDDISSCRKSIDDITKWYKGYGKDDDKGNFAKQYKRAANERLTDVITVFRELARNGTVAVNSGRGKKKIAFNRRSAIEALGYEAKSLEIINGTVRDITDGKEGAFAEIVVPSDRTLSSKNRTVYSLYSPRHGYVLLHTRPEGTHSFDPQLEYGKVSNRYDANSTNTGTEASISFITNPVEPFSLPTPYKDLPWVKHRRKKSKINKEKSNTERTAEDYKHDRVSAIRLDREGRSPGMPADDPNRDPIAPFGMVSVDLSAIGDGPSTPSGKIARLITVGNTLRAQERGSSETYLNHNTKGFSHDKYGTAEGFAKIVQYIDVRMQKIAEDHPPGTGEGLVKKWEKLAEQEELELELIQAHNQRLGERAMVGAIQGSPILPIAEPPNTSELPDTPESSDTPESQGAPMSA